MKQLLLTLIIVSALIDAAAAQISPATSLRTISVSGTAEIRVAPDEVNLRLGIETRDPKLDEAVQQNDARIAAVLKFLKESGLDAKDIQTDFVEIQPHYNSDERSASGRFEATPSGDRKAQQLVPEFYLVRRNLGVHLRKVGQFDAVLAGTLKSGANHVIGIEFRTTELRKHRDAARQQAIRAAKEKAVALAQELDAKVGKPQNINEQTSGGWWSWPGASLNMSNAMFQNTTQSPVTSESPDGNLAIGLISITATVHVTFALE